MKYLGVAGVLLGLSLLGVPALADEAKQPVPRVGQVVIESMGPASGTIPKGKLATIVNYIHADKHTCIKMVPGTRPSIPLIRVRSGICTIGLSSRCVTGLATATTCVSPRPL